MTQLNILEYPHPHLKKVTIPVTVFDETLKNTIQTLFAMMYKDEGVGLAANQVGLSQRFFVMDTSDEGDVPVCFINPEIIATEGETDSEEGCLSLPGIYVKIKRAQQVTVKYQNSEGETQTLTTDGLTALCIQHELDHLNGILAIDRLSKLKRALYVKKMEKQLALGS